MKLGVIGLGTMGANLARNAARNGADVSVFNRTQSKTDEFMKQFGSEGNFVACHTHHDLVASLESPRAILIMVKAGEAVDEVIEDLLPQLDEGDILIDGGNSHFTDTQRRFDHLSERKIRFVGMGVSGGEAGALEGPSMMPGGDKSAFDHLKPLLADMAASDGKGGKCVSYIGSGGAGHFVKMAHNGIEYGVMQLLAESYDFMKNVGGFSYEDLAQAYTAWNDSRILRSYLMEITAKIFTVKDTESDGYLLEKILDQAGQKGTGKWTTQAALDLGVAIPTINAAVDSRIISSSVERRKRRQGFKRFVDEHDPVPPKNKLMSQMRNALKQSVICAYNQGFELIDSASSEYSWNIDSGEVARIWMGGCIIRAEILNEISSLYSKNSNVNQVGKESLLERFDQERQLDWRRIVELGASRGISLPAMFASLCYYDSYSRVSLPQNLIQAQRDFFGAHTYKRTDKEGSFHTEWED